eukprot:scaffold37750_cov161-Skeletonema_marinoi.AAC.3
MVQHQSDAEDDNDRPSLYALGTSVRSMRSITRKSMMPVDVDCNKRRQKLKWLKSFYRLDPRWQICNFFDLHTKGVTFDKHVAMLRKDGILRFLFFP